MKGNKLKVNQVPSAYTLWLARILSHPVKTKGKLLRKGRATFGYNKTARKMLRLGYKPKYAQYPSKYSCFDR